DEPVAAYRDPPLARLGRWGRRHRVVVAGAAVLLVTAMAGLGLGLVAVGYERQNTVQERDDKERVRAALAQTHADSEQKKKWEEESRRFQRDEFKREVLKQAWADFRLLSDDLVLGFATPPL